MPRSLLPLLLAFACTRTTPSQVTKRPTLDAGISFEEMLTGAMEELRLKTEAHQVWGLGRLARWDLSQDEGILRFTDPDGTIAEAPAQIVGDLDTDSGTWLWAWANPHVNEALTKHARAVKEYGRAHGVPKLAEGEWPATEDDGWKRAALAASLNGAQGAYRGPAGNVLVFITFGKVKVRNVKAR